MTDRPILFSAPMVRALIAGRKTQTRRCSPCPLANCQPGDVLWVRETWQTHCDHDSIKPSDLPVTAGVQYPATYDGWVSKRRPAIHMPRWTSRLTLLVTDVHFHQLQDISARDAIAEGIPLSDHLCGCERCSQTSELCPATASSVIMAFSDLWVGLHGQAGWDANPRVVALAFRVVPGNIDQLAA